jgi:tetratricopeptide (TPR) repeat protein
LEQLDPNAPDYAENSAKIQADRLAYQLAECQLRAEKYPSDLQVRFELGELYFRAGKITTAMQEFQKAQSNPHRRIQALSYLGQCFARRGMNDLAARTLQNAIKEKVVFDDEKKELIYALGCVFEKMGKAEEASTIQADLRKRHRLRRGRQGGRLLLQQIIAAKPIFRQMVHSITRS